MITNSVTGKTFAVFSMPFGFECKMRVVLVISDPKKRTKTHYDKKRGKTVFHHPHNVSEDLSVPREWVELPNQLDKMLKTHNIKFY